MESIFKTRLALTLDYEIKYKVTVHYRISHKNS